MSKLINTLANYVVNNNGTVDVDATCAKVREALAAEVEAVKGIDAKIEACLHSIFDGVEAGKAIPTEAVVGKVASELAGGDILATASMTEAVYAYLERSHLFRGKRGRNGGLTRI